MHLSTKTRILIRRIAVYGGAAILAAYFVAWWFATGSQSRQYAVIAGLACVAVYFALLRFRFRLKTIVLIMVIVAAIYGHHCNPVYKFVNQRRATMAAEDLGARLGTSRYVSTVNGQSILAFAAHHESMYVHQLTEKQKERAGKRCLTSTPSSKIVVASLSGLFDAKAMAHQLNRMPSLQQVVFRSCDDATIEMIKELEHQDLIISINLTSVTPNGLSKAMSSLRNIKSLQLSTSESVQVKDLSCLRESRITSLSVYVGARPNTQVPLVAKDFHALAAIQSLEHLSIAISPHAAAIQLQMKHLAVENQTGRPSLNWRALTDQETEPFLPAKFRERLKSIELSVSEYPQYQPW